MATDIFNLLIGLEIETSIKNGVLMSKPRYYCDFCGWGTSKLAEIRLVQVEKCPSDPSLSPSYGYYQLCKRKRTRNGGSCYWNLWKARRLPKPADMEVDERSAQDESLSTDICLPMPSVAENFGADSTLPEASAVPSETYPSPNREANGKVWQRSNRL